MAEELVGANVADTDATKPDHVEELENAEPDGGDTDPQTDANEGEPKHKPKGGWQRKIERLEREVQTLRQATPAPVVETPKPDPFTFDKPEPDPKQFDLGDGTYDVAKYTKAMIQYERDKAKAEDAHEQKHKDTIQQTKREQEKQVETVTAWREKNAKAIAKYDDFGPALKASAVVASPLMHEAILNSDYGADLAYHFATHEDEALNISQMNAYQAGKAIDKIEARFAKQEPEAKEPEEEPMPPVKSSPAPPNPVSKPSPAVAKFDPVKNADLPYKEWVKKREAQLRK